MFRILSLVFAIVIFVGGLILIVGYTTLPSYNSSTTFEVGYSPELVWQELIKIQLIPSRKGDVVSVNVLEEYGKLIAWQENLRNGGYRIYRMNERQENSRLVLELTDSSYGLTGIWTFDLRSNNNKTDVTITEQSVLGDLKLRGYRVLFGRDHDLLVWVKYIKVSLLQSLLVTP